jgi:hypothetical protein
LHGMRLCWRGVRECIKCKNAGKSQPAAHSSPRPLGRLSPPWAHPLGQIGTLA